GVDVRRRADAADCLGALGRSLRDQRDAFDASVASHLENERSPGTAAYLGDQLVPPRDRYGIDRDDSVSCGESSPLGNAATNHLPDDRGHIWAVETKPELREEIALEFFGRDTREVERARRDCAARIHYLDSRALAIERELQQPPSNVLPARDGLAVDRPDRLATREACLRGDRARLRCAHDRLRFRNAGDEQRPEKRNREQEVRHRTGCDDRDPFPDTLTVECPRHLGRGPRPPALIQHLPVPAERYGGDDPLRPVRADGVHEERAAEAQREAQHPDPATAGEEIVPELVHDDQHCERDHKRRDGVQEAHADLASARASASVASRRAAASAASTSSSVAIGAVVKRCRVASITSVMRGNGRVPSRNAPTATSFAALKIVGAVPPAPSTS